MPKYQEVTFVKTATGHIQKKRLVKIWENGKNISGDMVDRYLSTKFGVSSLDDNAFYGRTMQLALLMQSSRDKCRDRNHVKTARYSVHRCLIATVDLQRQNIQDSVKAGNAYLPDTVPAPPLWPGVLPSGRRTPSVVPRNHGLVWPSPRLPLQRGGSAGPPLAQQGGPEKSRRVKGV